MLKSFYSRVWCETHATNQFKSTNDVDRNRVDNVKYNSTDDDRIGIVDKLLCAAMAIVVGLMLMCIAAIWF